MKKILFCFGTRPEAIKMAPIIRQCKDFGFLPVVCISGQHREMIIPFLDLFEIEVHYNLDIMKAVQGLSYITTSIIQGLDPILQKERPDFVCVQGDTSTTFASALTAFYHKIPVLHVEAGLRTQNRYSPFPEEINRRMTTEIATFHFAPTELSAQNLNSEGHYKNVHVTGNTSIDALEITLEKLRGDKIEAKFNFLEGLSDKKMILLTSHRRENFGKPQESIFSSVLDTLEQSDDCFVVFPVHMNPVVQKAARDYFGDHKRVFLIEPLGYEEFVWMMKRCHFIMSDSGGVQEEAPHLGKPVLVLRDTTERPEGVDAGVNFLVGLEREKILNMTLRLINDHDFYSRVQSIRNPYGDGAAASKILKIVSESTNG